MRAVTVCAVSASLILSACGITACWWFPSYVNNIPALPQDVWQVCLVVWALLVVVNVSSALWLAGLAWARARSLKHALHATLMSVENTQELLVSKQAHKFVLLLNYSTRRTCFLPSYLQM